MLKYVQSQILGMSYFAKGNMFGYFQIINSRWNVFIFSVLGKRLGKAMGNVSKEVKGMSQEHILTFERVGEVTLAGHCLRLGDIKVFSSVPLQFKSLLLRLCSGTWIWK